MYLMRLDLHLERQVHPEHFAFPIKRYDVFYVTRDVFRKIYAGYAYAGNWTAKRNIARHSDDTSSRFFDKHLRFSVVQRFVGPA